MFASAIVITRPGYLTNDTFLGFIWKNLVKMRELNARWRWLYQFYTGCRTFQPHNFPPPPLNLFILMAWNTFIPSECEASGCVFHLYPAETGLYLQLLHQLPGLADAHGAVHWGVSFHPVHNSKVSQVISPSAFQAAHPIIISMLQWVTTDMVQAAVIKKKLAFKLKYETVQSDQINQDVWTR